MDTEGETGKRSLKLSGFKQALEGFNFNRNYPLNTVLRVSPSVELNRKKLQAIVTIPRINTDIDLLNVQRLPFFRLLIALGTVSDLEYKAEINDYSPLMFNLHGVSETVSGAWNSTQTILPEQIVTVGLGQEEMNQLTENVTILVSLAVEFGNVGFTGEPVEVKYAGSGKVLKVG